MANATVTGFDRVEAVDAYVPHNQRATRIWIVGEMDSRKAEKWDRDNVTVTLVGRNAEIVFTGMKTIKESRKHSRVKLLLEGPRRNLRYQESSVQWNIRAIDGEIEDTSRIELDELWDQIGLSNGFNVEVDGGVARNIYPPSPSRMLFKQVASEVLKVTASRMIPKVDGSGFKILSATTGDLPDFNPTRVFSPKEGKVPASVNVRTGPIIYQSDADVEAVVMDDNGDYQPIGNVCNPQDYFSGFTNGAAINVARLQNSAFRLWRVRQHNSAFPFGADKIRLVKGQAQTLVNDRTVLTIEPEFYGAGMMWRGWVPVAGNRAQVKFNGAIGNRILSVNEPIIRITGGQIQTDCKCRMAFHGTDGGKLVTWNKSRAVVGGEGPEETVDAYWITPIFSTTPGINAQNWSDEHEQILIEQAAGFAQPRQLVHLHDITDIGTTSGKVGGVRYRMNLFPRLQADTILAINYTPHDPPIR